MNAIEISNIAKSYGRAHVLEGLSLRVEKGEVYGLLGPNGAGKSTLIHLLLGFLRPNSGAISVHGSSPGGAASRVGYLPERVRYHTHFTAIELLKALGRMSGMSSRRLSARVSQVLEMVDLLPEANKRLGHYSKGMLQRFGIAQAIIHEPELLLIDEPTSGLDPAGQRQMLDLLARLRAEGRTILMCSHQLAEVEEICSRVGILRHGNLAVEVRVADMRRTGQARVIVENEEALSLVVRSLLSLGDGVSYSGREILVEENGHTCQDVLRILIDAGVVVEEVRRQRSGLEDLYIRVTGGRR